MSSSSNCSSGVAYTLLTLDIHTHMHIHKHTCMLRYLWKKAFIVQRTVDVFQVEITVAARCVREF